jgi:hypothetical protein
LISVQYQPQQKVKETPSQPKAGCVDTCLSSQQCQKPKIEGLSVWAKSETLISKITRGKGQEVWLEQHYLARVRPEYHQIINKQIAIFLA